TRAWCATQWYMTQKQVVAIREAMGLTQAQFAERLRVSRNSVARIEVGLQVITPAMALLIEYVAKDHEALDRERSRRRARRQRVDSAKARPSRRKDRPGQGITAVQKRRR